jgi:hypothetical protein
MQGGPASSSSWTSGTNTPALDSTEGHNQASKDALNNNRIAIGDLRVGMTEILGIPVFGEPV